jgi:ferrochelatase
MEKIGVLVTHTGSPAAPTPAALRPYLAEFLADRRIVNLPTWLWLPILHTIILNTRPKRSARLYENIWTEAGSPLLVMVDRQVKAIRTRIGRQVETPVKVVSGMHYGQPSIGSALEALRKAGTERVLVFPLFPQYSRTTFASALDAVAAELGRMAWKPALRSVEHYHAHPGYLDALADSITAYWRANGKPERMLFSFHGIPQSYARAGDPYEQACRETAFWTAERLGLSERDWEIGFQSRFGPVAWLQPYTDVLLGEWGRAGIECVDVVCPGFSVDCLETIDEIGREGTHTFQEAGGGSLRYIPALNDRPDHLQALTDIALAHLGDWIGEDK